LKAKAKLSEIKPVSLIVSQLTGSSEDQKPPEFRRERSMHENTPHAKQRAGSLLETRKACADNRFNDLINLVDRNYELETEKDVEKIIERNPVLKRLEEEKKDEELMKLRRERSVTSAIARKAREAVNSGEYSFWKL